MFSHLPYWPKVYLQTGLIAFAIAAAAMPIAIILLRSMGVVDPVCKDKLHRKPTPRGGGIIIFVAFAVAVLLPNYRDNPMKGVVLGAFICLIVGAIDDFRGGIPAVFKFITLVIVTFVMARYGVCLRIFNWYPLDLLVTILWVVGMTSAFNGLDNMDGLAGGVAAIVCAMFLIIAVQDFALVGTENEKSWFGLLAAGMVGATLGFLVYNFKPARIFMGDSGSFFLGFTIAALSVMGEWGENPVTDWTIPLLILAVPLFDFSYIIIARIIRRETRSLRAIIEHCAMDHLSHRLCWIGFSQRNAVLFIYVITLTLGITGILLRKSLDVSDSFLALLQGFAVVFIVIILMATAARRHSDYILEEATRLYEQMKETRNAQQQLEFPQFPPKSKRSE